MENEFKGAKGDWIIFKTEDEFAIVNKDKDQAICFVPILFDKSEANAKLISCAPEMLEMLKEIDECGYDFSGWDRLESVIKKATDL